MGWPFFADSFIFCDHQQRVLGRTMGRIQRKKSPGDKKRKKQRASSSEKAPAAKPGASAKGQGVASAGSAKGAKKSAATTQKTSVVGAAPAAARATESFFSKALQFLREVKVELKKVAWPSRKQTIGSTAVVIALVMLISLFLGVVDMGLSTLIQFVLN
jgi:preprotein translocase subunit SecE